MNQRDLKTIIQKEHALPSRESSRVLTTILDAIKKELRAGRIVRLRNFGTFSTKTYSAKVYQDVKTGKIKTLPARTKVKYSPSRNILVDIQKSKVEYSDAKLDKIEQLAMGKGGTRFKSASAAKRYLKSL